MDNIQSFFCSTIGARKLRLRFMMVHTISSRIEIIQDLLNYRANDYNFQKRFWTRMMHLQATLNFQVIDLLKHHAQHSTSMVQCAKNMLSSITFNKLYQKSKCQVTFFHETLNLVFLILTMKLEIQTLNKSMDFSYWQNQASILQTP